MHFVDNHKCCVVAFAYTISHSWRYGYYLLDFVLYCVGYVNIQFNSTAFYASCLLHYIEELIFEL